MRLLPPSYLFYIWWCIYVHATLTSSQLTLPPPSVLKSILYVCIFIPVLSILNETKAYFNYVYPLSC